MATHVTGRNLSEAWAQALRVALDADGKCVNLAVSWEGADEDERIRTAVDSFLAARRKDAGHHWPVWSVETVANTIFPADLYVPAKGDEAIALFTDLYLEGREFARSVSPEGEYCERLVAWPGIDGPVNQLEAVAKKLRKIRDRGRDGKGSLSSDYELAFAHPVDSYDLRLQAPGLNKSPYGFPCLSHVSVTIHSKVLHLSAMYRNQHLTRKGYGNYLGLTRLAAALANEAGLALGEVLVLATHADAEIGTSPGFGKTALRALAETASRND